MPQLRWLRVPVRAACFIALAGGTIAKEARVLTADQAATVALRHGLSLNDAAALLNLADDEPTADKLAARFALDAGSEVQLVRDVFGSRHDEQPEGIGDDKPGGYVAAEGTGQTSGVAHDDAATIARDLFR